jgi:hypothetical protein
MPVQWILHDQSPPTNLLLISEIIYGFPNSGEPKQRKRKGIREVRECPCKIHPPKLQTNFESGCIILVIIKNPASSR